MNTTVARFVERVRTAYDAALPELRIQTGYGCSFHLSPCYCGAPIWSQPCAVCGFYPDWSNPRITGTSWARGSCTRETFVRLAENHGCVAAWYFAGFRRTVAYKPHSDFAATIETLIADAKGWSDAPTPAEIWDAFYPATAPAAAS
ncbi:MAG: hypothetical protein M3418_13545 [Gemmatimonadota bacterium]|nr:hypothetical protein [Gemmatimonadota bacterium]